MFYFQKSVIGGRVFIHDDAPKSVHDFFAKISAWKGADKVGENYQSYEIENEHEWMIDNINHF